MNQNRRKRRLRGVDASQLARGGYRRDAFTLVEMLVAVALVLLMMTMFAQIFQLAGGTITKQRGIAENDQRSRTLQTILKADLDKRTFRLAMPWSSAEDNTLDEVRGGERLGYFYISENDPNNDSEDVLQFTVSSYGRRENRDLTKYFGKASAPTALNWQTTISGQQFLTFGNQPEADDFWSTPNGTAEAPGAEIAYFVRGSKLYRRVLLVRQPSLGRTGQPNYDNFGGDAFDYTATIPTGVSALPYPQNSPFWNDFDHSAFPQLGVNAGGPTQIYAYLHSMNDLQIASTQFAFGRPQFRFGHRPLLAGIGRAGCPREFDTPDASNVVRYFGRFTQEETSNFNFRYPQGLSNAIAGTINPMTGTLTLDDNLTTNSSTDYLFPDFAFGSRRGEDLLLSNVHAFDVKVWDDVVNGFVDIGKATSDSGSPAARAFATGAGAPPDQRLNPFYGPVDPANAFAAPYNSNRVFDSWHPAISLDFNGDGTVSAVEKSPPFRHLIYYPANQANPSVNGYAVAQQPNWSANTPYSVGDIVFPLNNQRANGQRFYYRCVAVGGSATSGATEPTIQRWPAAAGARVRDPYNSTTDYVVWEAVENWRPLKAIQITVRYFDTTSEQMRQQTIVHSLVD